MELNLGCLVVCMDLVLPRTKAMSGITCCTHVTWYKLAPGFSSNRDLVDEAKDYHLMPERRPHLPAYKTRQRCCTSIAGLIYAVGGLNSAGAFLFICHTVTCVCVIVRDESGEQKTLGLYL